MRFHQFTWQEEMHMISYTKASPDDIPRIFELCKQLIDAYENIDQIDYDRVLKWISRKGYDLSSCFGV